jgi:hypothetical protein
MEEKTILSNVKLRSSFLSNNVTLQRTLKLCIKRVYGMSPEESTHFRGLASTRCPIVTKLVSWLDMNHARDDTLQPYTQNSGLSVWNTQETTAHREGAQGSYIRTSFSNSVCLTDHQVATALWIRYKNPTLKYNHMHWFLSQVQFLTHRHNKALWNEMLHNTVGHDNWFSNHHRTKLFEHIITCQWRHALAHLE